MDEERAYKNFVGKSERLRD
jgi:hypothetical protein